MSAVAGRLNEIQAQLERAAKSTHRLANEILLVAVSKTHPVDSVIEAYAAGQIHFGENRVQEAKAKFASLKEKHSDLKLHLIGPLQSNKAVDAVELFDVIETLDRETLAKALAAALEKTGRKPDLYVEVNIGNEPQKAGIAPAKLAAFLRLCRDTYRLTVKGLMCIPPHYEDPKPYFVQMKKLADAHQLDKISMGMSADFEEAIQCGATEVRIGTAIFGARPSSRD